MSNKNRARRFSKNLFFLIFILTVSPNSTVAGNTSWFLQNAIHFNFLTALPEQPPRLLTQGASTRGVALDATNFCAEPFSLTGPLSFGSDARTRLLLFATNIDAATIGAGFNALSADAEDADHHIFPLTVEYADKLPADDSVYAIHIRLNDDMSATGDVLVRIFNNGLASNRVRIGLGCVGGGPPDDPAPQPSPSPSLPPAITELSPSTVTAGAGGFMLSIRGLNFTSDSTVQFNGAAAGATYVNNNLMLAQLSNSDIDNAGTYAVTIQSPGRGLSNPVMLAVDNPQPVISSLSPSSAIRGSAGFNLNITGNGFVPQSAVRLNGSNRVATFVSATLLTVQILAADVAVAGSFPLNVTNPSPGGGSCSSVTFNVSDPAPSPSPTPSPTPVPTPIPTPNPTPTPSGVISYPTAIQNLSLLPSKTAYYRFTETSGRSISDASGGGHTGTASGTVTLNLPSLVTGDPNPSALFDGGTVTSPLFMPSLTTGLTLSCLFQPTAWPATSNRYYLVSTGNGGTGGLFQLFYTNDPGVFAYAFVDITGNTVTLLFPAFQGNQALNRTHHVAVTHDFASKTVKMYLDGMLVSTQNYLITPRTASNMPVHVGMDNVHGFIDEALAAGDRVLTEAEIRSLMRASVGADQSATEFYVSPTGTYRASGSISNPIDLYTAFRSGLAAPGQTYWLRGGTYNAPSGTPTNGFWIFSKGRPGNPIRFKGYADERAIIDGANMALGGNSYGVVDLVASDAVVRVTSPSDYVELWNLEFTNTNADAAGNRSHFRPNGLIVNAPHVKLIGVSVYDNGQGILTGVGATDLEVHGSLIFNNGSWLASGGSIDPICNCNPTGHNIYSENSDLVHRKLFKNSVLWGASDFNFHGFGTGAQVSGTDLDGVVGFMTGMWQSTTKSGTNFGFVALKPMRSNTISNSVAYVKSDRNGGNFSIGRGGDPHEYFTLTGNKSFGTGRIELIDLAHLTFSNNLMIDTRPSAQGANGNYGTYYRPLDYSMFTGYQYSLDHLYSYGGLKGSWTGTGNTYAGLGYSTSTPIWNEDGIANYNIAAWRTLTNIDANAVIRNTSTNPYTSPLVYYFPNTYETGKGFVSVYNPPAASTVSIDLSQLGIVVGQAYKIRDVMNPFVDLATGTYTGSAVSISMTGTTVRTPIGYTIAGSAASRTSREFKTFLIVRG